MLPTHRVKITADEYTTLMKIPYHQRMDYFFDILRPGRFLDWQFGYGVYGFRVADPDYEQGEYVVYITTGSHCD